MMRWSTVSRSSSEARARPERISSSRRSTSRPAYRGAGAPNRPARAGRASRASRARDSGPDGTVGRWGGTSARLRWSRGVEEVPDMKPTVSQVMTPDVVTVDALAPFKEVVRLMQEHRVSALPVVDTDGVLVGIVSEGDLILKEDPELG